MTNALILVIALLQLSTLGVILIPKWKKQRHDRRFAKSAQSWLVKAFPELHAKHDYDAAVVRVHEGTSKDSLKNRSACDGDHDGVADAGNGVSRIYRS